MEHNLKRKIMNTSFSIDNSLDGFDMTFAGMIEDREDYKHSQYITDTFIDKIKLTKLEDRIYRVWRKSGDLQEVADITGTKPNTVDNVIQRVRRKMTRYVENKKLSHRDFGELYDYDWR